MDAQPLDNEAPKSVLKRLGCAFLGLLQGHVELLGLEVQEEKARTFKLFLLGSLCLVFSLLTLIGFSSLIIMLAWETHRILAASLLCLFYLLAGIICAYKATVLIKRAGTPFHATLEELQRNRERLIL